MTDNETEVPHLNKVYAKYDEVYEYFPNENDPDPHKWHAKFPGDMRAAVAPFAAHRAFGDGYKWMLYGDDDTVFFMPNVRRLLSRFDPELPIALSDNLWYDSRHPRLESYRCLPCGFNKTGDKLPKAQLDTKYVPRPSCPYCTPENACPETKPNCTMTGAHGGAGMLLSVGLMRKLLYDDALACINSLIGYSGGDSLVSQCIWRVGVGFTDPGDSLLYDSPYDHVTFDNLANRLLVKDPMGALVVGNCDEGCSSLIRTAISFHMRGKSYSSFPKAAAAMFGLVEAHNSALEFLELLDNVDSRAGRPVGTRQSTKRAARPAGISAHASVAAFGRTPTEAEAAVRKKDL
ncbi:hypothetical protein HYH03_010197 [Edaphochlamys debaryana]|uniref:Uncharacterized protein n=1 Tax=Edaphochlamys debaryana TaxID=47281 RepID=A0A835XZQ5_9CHLO|nr:hypothetical protein HYH03_010197 [Edaphochlamys debaryana]|eukprot:KAG2491406.1 hypothetical protein HYH03_010197 [Edaphochlamys debaryana]